MRTKILAAALVFTLVGGAARGAEAETKPDAKLEIPAGTSEPTKCYRLIAESGLEVPVGQAVELCAGSVSAGKTFACFIEAWGPSTSNGLGLPLGLAVDLCRTIPRE